MKNHIQVDGQILQTNKKWPQLKQIQKDLIAGWLQSEYRLFIERFLRKPKSHEEDYILEAVMEQIHERGIWISYQEVKIYYSKKKGKWYRKLETEFENNRKKEITSNFT
ncbi:transposase [Bacillus thuringiensis serovar yunnanensis]|nr:transposase [Bacillus thuringiensis serovar yunnanensis]